MAHIHTRHVRLVQLAGNILDLERSEQGRRAGEIAHRLFERRQIRNTIGREQAFLRQRLCEVLLVGCPGHALVGSLFRFEDAQRLPQVDIETLPPAGEGRQVVGGDHGEGRARIFARLLEGRARPLEGQDAVAQDARFHDGIGKAFRCRAQILCDHQALRAVALHAQHGQHGFERVVHIGALRGRSAGWDQEEALQLESVVDADGARMAHIGRDEIAEGGKSLLLQGERIEGRQAPILSLGSEGIRGRSGGELRGIALGRRPDLGASPIRADGEVAIETDGQSGGVGMLGSLRELPIGQPLQPGMEGDALRMVQAKAPDGYGMDRAIILRPFADPEPALLTQMLRQRFEGRVRFQSLAALAPERFEGGVVARCPKRCPERIEKGTLDRPGLGIVDQLGAAEAGKARLQSRVVEKPLCVAFGEAVDLCRVDIDRLQEKA